MSTSNEQQPPRPAPWARFARPAATEPDRAASFPFGPPRPLVDAPQPTSSAAPPAGFPHLQGASWAPPPAPGPYGTQGYHDQQGHHGEQGQAGPVQVVPGPYGDQAADPFGSYFGDDEWSKPRPEREPDPGRGFAVAAIVFGVFVAPLGLLFGLIGLVRSRRAGLSGAASIVGIVIAAVVIVVSIAYGIAWIDYIGRLATACARVGPGEYVNGSGQPISCS